MITRKTGKYFAAVASGGLFAGFVTLSQPRIGKTQKKRLKEMRGEDTFGTQYANIDEMWQRELNPHYVPMEAVVAKE